MRRKYAAIRRSGIFSSIPYTGLPPPRYPDVLTETKDRKATTMGYRRRRTVDSTEDDTAQSGTSAKSRTPFPTESTNGDL